MLNKLYSELRMLSRNMKRYAHNGSKELGEYSHSEIGYLRILAESSGVSQRFLSEQLGIRPASITEITSRLEEKGMVVKTIDKDDRRRTRIFLTPEGQERLDNMKNTRDTYEAEFFSALTPDEQDTLFTLISKVNVAMAQQDSFHKGHHHHGSGHPGRDRGPGCGHGAGPHAHMGRRDGGCKRHRGIDCTDRPSDQPLGDGDTAEGN